MQYNSISNIVQNKESWEPETTILHVYSFIQVPETTIRPLHSGYMYIATKGTNFLESRSDQVYNQILYNAQKLDTSEHSLI
jgi:hypothetical protein